jgi:hypothetical protein
MSSRLSGFISALGMTWCVLAQGTLAQTGDTTRVSPQTLNAGQSWVEMTHIVPPPQPPLVILGDRGIDPVREAFRAADGLPRVVLMMSPT